MTSRATWMLLTLAALPFAITAAQAQNSEYDALPKPAVSAPAAPPAPAVTEKQPAPGPKQKSAGEIAAEKKAAADKAAAEKKASAEKAALEKAAEKAEKEKAGEKKAVALPAEKEPALKKQGAALKQDSKKEEDIQLGHKMAPSAAIPPWPGDEKGPKTIEFLGACPGNFDHCMDQVREIGEKMSAAELCIPPDLYFANVTDRVRKWATLRPDVQGLPAGRVIAAALRSIYPCKQTPPARTAAEKGGPKAAKAAQ